MKNRPIILFDSGVGSYSIVRELVKLLPNENIIYLADRKSFPYGGKTREGLKENMKKTIAFFEKNYDPKLIVLASNTPSIQVLDELKQENKASLFGVFPPVKEAYEKSKTKQIAILATAGAVKSPEILDFISEELGDKKCNVHKINASPLVDLIEPGTFIVDPEKSKLTCKEVLDDFIQNTSIDVMTLSSTHLPFLRVYLEELYPQVTFLDPAASVSEEIQSYLEKNNILNIGEGNIQVLGTECEKKKLYNKDLKEIFRKMGFECRVEKVVI